MASTAFVRRARTAEPMTENKNKTDKKVTLSAPNTYTTSTNEDGNENNE